MGSGLEGITTGIQLYRYIYRIIQKLPTESQSYYKHYVKQQFISHRDEIDPERVQQIITRAIHDADWIKSKYIPKNQ